MGEPDRPEFADFVRHRVHALYRYAYVLTRSRCAAEDLVEETLVRTGLSWSRAAQRQDDPEGYARQVMARLAARRRHQRCCHGLTCPQEQPPVTDPVERTLADLSPRQRVLLALRYVDGLTEPEIADVLGSSRASVRGQVAQALDRLRAALATPGVTRG